MKFRTKYEPRRIHKSFAGVRSLTDPQYKDECTIDGIIRRYGVLPKSEVQPIGGDVSEYGDFADCMERVNAALEQFNALPSALRERFGNDPRAYYEFVVNPTNLEECVKLGICIKREDKRDVVELLQEISDKVSPAKATEA